MKWYVGRRLDDNKLQAFPSVDQPTLSSHGGLFLYCIGPFVTERGAMFLERYPFTIAQTVDEIEKFAAKEAR